MAKTILLCTVGGSPDPIVKAIESRKPDYVVFVCTGPSDTNPGSRVQIEGPIPPPPPNRPQPHDPRTIPERTALERGSWEVLEVPADDPDAAFWRARELLRDVRKCFPGAEVVVDYTGGTKSMTAGLMLAAVAEPAPVAIQFIGGARPDLVRVLSGTERPLTIAIDAISAERALVDAERAAARFAYDEAAALLERWTPEEEGRRLPQALGVRLAEAHRLACAFAAWDRFAHGQALEILEPLADREWVYRLLLPLHELARNADRVETSDGRRRWLPPEDPLLPLDIWHNAVRRAAQGRFDDAIARGYRVVEATVQWILWREREIDTYAVRPDQISEELFAQLGRRKSEEPPKTFKAGFEQALDIVRYELREHWLTELLGPKELDSKKSKRTEILQRLLAWKERRNQSILNHGFEPLAEADWREVEVWLSEHLVPPLERAAEEAGLVLPQLPTSLSGLTEAP